MPIRHRFVLAKSESPDPTLVSTHGWNDDHVITGTATEVNPAMSTVEIQAALTAGGTVYFSDGTYSLGCLVLATRVRIQFGQVIINGNSPCHLFTINGVNTVFEGISGRESVLKPTAGYDGIYLTPGVNWYAAGTGLTERPHFRCVGMGFDGGLHGIEAPSGTSSGLQWRYIVDDCDFVNQTSYALHIGPSVFYTYVSRCYARDVYGFADVYDDTETKFYGCTVEVKANGGPGYRLVGSHRVVIESGDILGGRFGNVNPDILIIPNNVDGSTDGVASSGVVTLRDNRFGPEFDQSLLIRPKILVYNPDLDLAAISLHISNNRFYGAGPMAVASVSRTGNVATITITMPSTPRYDSETYTDHFATVGSEIRLSGMPNANNELNGAHIITAVTGTTISFASTGADFATTATAGGVVINGNSRCIQLRNPIETSHIVDNDIANFRYFIDTSSSPGGSPYGKSGTSVYRGNNLSPVYNGNTLAFTTEPRDFHHFEVMPGSNSPGFNAMIPVVQSVQTQNRIIESDLSTWDTYGTTVTGPVSNGMGALSAWQLARDQAGSALNSTFNVTTKKREYTLIAGVSQLLDYTSSPRQSGSGVIQFRARAVGVAPNATCLCVGIIDKTTNLLYCFEVVNLLDSALWPAKVYRIPFRYRTGFDPVNTHIFIIPGYWYGHKATVLVDQVSVSDVPSDFLRTTGAEALATDLGSVWRQDVALSNVRAIPGPEGAPAVSVVAASLGTGGTVSLFHGGSSLAGTIQLNTGAGAPATGSVAVTVKKRLLHAVVLCSLEDGDGTNWEPTATVVLEGRNLSVANETGFEFRWTNAAVALTASTANCARINYWIVQVTDTGWS